MKKRLPALAALATYAGTIIGVGIFGLPYVTLKAGLWPVVIFFAVITPLMILVNLFFGEVSLHIEGNHRLPGYVEKFWGSKFKHFVFFIAGAGLVGALLSYLIVGGQFLDNIFSPIFGGTQVVWVLVFFVLGAFLIYKGIVSVAETETVMLTLLLALVALYAIVGFDKIKVPNFTVAGDWQDVFLPWGVIIFSLGGMTSVPLIRDMLVNRHRAFKRVIVGGILISAVVYLIFILVTLGIVGSDLEPNAVISLANYFPASILFFVYVFGFLAVFTSFLALGFELRTILIDDYSFAPRVAWLVACVTPLLLYFLGISNFVKVIGFVGAISWGAIGIIIFMMYLKLEEQGKKMFFKVRLPKFVVYILMAVFALGIGAELFYLLR